MRISVNHFGEVIRELVLEGEEPQSQPSRDYIEWEGSKNHRVVTEIVEYR